MKYLCIFLLFIGILSSKEMTIAIDGAVFKFDEHSVKWEFYYSINDNSFNYISKDKKYFASAQIKLILKSNVKTIIDTSWNVEHSVDLISDIGNMQLFGTKSFVIPPGEYIVQVEVTDLNDIKSIEKTEFRFITNKFYQDRICFSDIQLAQLIQTEETKSLNWDEMFYKNTMYILPNASTEIKGEDLNILLYMEIYNAKLFSPNGLKLRYNIKDAGRREVFNYEKEKKSFSDAMIETINIPVNLIPTGVYSLNITGIYPVDDTYDSVTISKRIYIINTNVPLQQIANFTEDELFERSEFASYYENRANLELRMSKTIATLEEISTMEILGTLKAKQRFLYKFWKNRDIDTNESFNERLVKFRESVEYANTYFKHSSKDGWETERGDIMLKYGIPNTREVKDAYGSIKAFEEWHYNTIDGGVYFFFVDLSTYNNFILVHSTHSKHVYNPDWYSQYVDKNGETNETKYQNSDYNLNRKR